MEQIHYKFPHIEQLRNVITDLKHKYQNPVQTSDGWVFDESLPLPTITFEGTVKLHGTNTAIIFPFENGQYDLYCQSRERVVTTKDDIFGFTSFVQKIESKLYEVRQTLFGVLCSKLFATLETPETIKVFGEWCGKGIQAGVAISQLDKMFVIFAVQVGNRWLEPKEFKHMELEEYRIFNIYRCPISWVIKVDFNDQPELNKTVEILERWTKQVEEECPFSKTFGVSGLGEGLVWRSLDDNRDKNFCGGNQGDPWMFKTKGEKHKNVKESKLIQLAPDQLNNIADLVCSVVTEQRLEQFFEKLKTDNLPLTKQSTGLFIKWVQNDIQRENEDTIKASGLPENKVLTEIQNKAREWYFKKVGP